MIHSTHSLSLIMKVRGDRFHAVTLFPLASLPVPSSCLFFLFRQMLRLCRDKDRQALGRGWRVLCRHTALSTAVAAGAAPADTSSPSADACDPKSGEIGDSIVPAAVGGIGPLHREKELQKLVGGQAMCRAVKINQFVTDQFVTNVCERLPSQCQSSSTVSSLDDTLCTMLFRVSGGRYVYG